MESTFYWYNGKFCSENKMYNIFCEEWRNSYEYREYLEEYEEEDTDETFDWYIGEQDFNLWLERFDTVDIDIDDYNNWLDDRYPNTDFGCSPYCESFYEEYIEDREEDEDEIEDEDE